MSLDRFFHQYSGVAVLREGGDVLDGRVSRRVDQHHTDRQGVEGPPQLQDLGFELRPHCEIVVVVRLGDR